MHKSILSVLLIFFFCGSLYPHVFEPHESETFAFRAKTLQFANQETITTLVKDAVDQIFEQRKEHYTRIIKTKKSEWMRNREACTDICWHIPAEYSIFFADEMIGYLDNLSQNIVDKNDFWNSAEQATKEILFNFCRGFYWAPYYNVLEVDQSLLNLENNISDKIKLKKMFG